MHARIADQRRQRPQRRRERRLRPGRRRWRRQRPKRCGRRGRSSSAASARGGGPAPRAPRARAGGGWSAAWRRGWRRPRRCRARRARARPRARPPVPPSTASAGRGPEPELALVGGAGEPAHRHVEARRLGAGDRRVDRGVDRLRLAQPVAPSGDDMSRRARGHPGDPRRRRGARRSPPTSSSPTSRAACSSSPASLGALALAWYRAAAPRCRRRLAAGLGPVALLALALGVAARRR